MRSEKNTVSFHYETAHGKKIQLQNYDSKLGELLEEGKHLTYSVNTELHVTNVKGSIKDGKLDYGNEVKFSFQVVDKITKKLVFAGSEQSTAYLVLKHKEENRPLPFTSNKQAAQQVFDKDGNPSSFSIAWSVNPNAVKGKGFLELVAQGADGKEIPIFEEASKSQWRINVEIGGTLSVSDRKFSSDFDEDDTVFFVEFDISCQTKQLNDAQLNAVISHSLTGTPDVKTPVISLPVTHGRQGGRYQVSWTKPTKQVKAGEYIVDFYREVDRRRALEKTSSAAATDNESKLEPLFSISFYHAGASGTKFPIKLEVIALISVGGAFFWMVFQKMEIEGTRKIKKKKTK